MTIEDEELLLAVLNSAPVEDGRTRELLTGSAGRRLARGHGGTGSAAELSHLQGVRGPLQRLVRGDDDATVDLTTVMGSVSLRPEVTPDGIRWDVDADRDAVLSARAIIAWSRVAQSMPGRLRPCANTDCNLFLLDHSRPGTARWCSMATCGNRAKARAHARRARETRRAT